jgi:hypothetical protein
MAARRERRAAQRRPGDGLEADQAAGLRPLRQPLRDFERRDLVGVAVDVVDGTFSRRVARKASTWAAWRHSPSISIRTSG